MNKWAPKVNLYCPSIYNVFGGTHVKSSPRLLKHELHSLLPILNFLLPQVSKKYVSKEVCTQIRSKVAPFIKWLKEAEEEDSSEEEEEEEVEVVYDTKAQQLKAQVDSTTVDEEDDELDIDAI